MNKDNALLEELTIKEVILGVISGTVILGCALYALINSYELSLGIFERINANSYYVKATKMGLFLISAALAAFCLIYLIVLRILKKLTFQKVNKTSKVLSTIILLGIISSLAVWPVLNNQLDRHSYHYCFFYSGSNIASPPVYVKNPDHCIATPRQNINEILAWFDEQEAAGVRLTAKDVQQKVDELKAISGY
ncbi:hypothetical protein [Kangiella sp.]|uniref:hypothetical protein n=1 Tax=Kangiella sp. TaxID=1920245 RepID=UPI0019B88511|nr:hypothetical protein [Kangiella sp.]MBD3653061.1 DUF1240 domain-containing protein [Kangiella sp.]